MFAWLKQASSLTAWRRLSSSSQHSTSDELDFVLSKIEQDDAPAAERQSEKAGDLDAYGSSSAWPEGRWLAELSGLESEVMAARSPVDVLVAVSHVSSSLRDGHLTFTPRGGWKEPGIAVLPVSFFQAGSPLAPRFFVQEAGLSMAPAWLRNPADCCVECETCKLTEVMTGPDRFEIPSMGGNVKAQLSRASEIVVLISGVHVTVRRVGTGQI